MLFKYNVERGPDLRKTHFRREQALAELFEIEASPHRLAAQLRIGFVVAKAPRADEGDDGLDEITPAAPLAIDGGESRLGAAQPAEVVDAEK